MTPCGLQLFAAGSFIHWHLTLVWQRGSMAKKLGQTWPFYWERLAEPSVSRSYCCTLYDRSRIWFTLMVENSFSHMSPISTWISEGLQISWYFNYVSQALRLKLRLYRVYHLQHRRNLSVLLFCVFLSTVVMLIHESSAPSTSAAATVPETTQHYCIILTRCDIIL